MLEHYNLYSYLTNKKKEKEKMQDNPFVWFVADESLFIEEYADT